MGVLYYNGQGVPQDYAEALKWYKLSAEQSNASAQGNLGKMYDFGEGVPQDHAEALKWYKLSAEQGHAEAQLSLGLSYVLGQGVPQDNINAYVWFSIASSSGIDLAVEALDKITKEMMPEDITKATDLARGCIAKKYRSCGD